MSWIRTKYLLISRQNIYQLLHQEEERNQSEIFNNVLVKNNKMYRVILTRNIMKNKTDS